MSSATETVVDLELATPAFVDEIIKLARTIVEKVHGYKEEPPHMKKLKEFGNNIVGGPLRLILDISAAAAVNGLNLDDASKRNLNACAVRLHIELKAADELLDKYINESHKFERIAHVFCWRSGIEKALRNLQKHEQEFSLLIDRIDIGPEHVPSQLLLDSTQFRIVGGETAEQPGYALPHSNIFLVEGNLKSIRTREDIIGQGIFILEGRRYDHAGGSKAETRGDIESLASKLINAKPKTGIPELVGYRDVEYRSSYELIFAIPSGFGPPRSLHSFLLDRNIKPPSLTYRLDICYQLAKAVLFTHNLNIVHKNIRPENLILLPSGNACLNEPSCQDFNTLLLTNWELVRNIGDATTFVGHDDWKRGIYQHPMRQGCRPEVEYCMGHDIYSLGVCMLEIFLWKTFVEEDGISQLYQERAIERNLVDEKYRGNTSGMVKKPSVVKNVLKDIAETELPFAVGDTMTKLVLSCLDGVENGFGDSNILGGKNTPSETRLKYIHDVLGLFSHYSDY